MHWRRTLWQELFPHTKRSATASEAAAIVVKILREQLTIVLELPNQPGVETMWSRRLVNSEDFEILYVASLRSVGVPSRLSGAGIAEFYEGSHWTTAPSPVAKTWTQD